MSYIAQNIEKITIVEGPWVHICCMKDSGVGHDPGTAMKAAGLVISTWLEGVTREDST